MPKTLANLLVLTTLFCGSGATCMHQYVPGYTYVPQAPRVLPETATLAQVIDVVNNNTGRVQSYHTSGARISAAGVPPLRADIALERPRRFRLRASTALTGPEVDLGSNDELFWFWVRRSQPPALFYCRHEQFAHSAARQFIPVDPQWLIDALGLPVLDPVGQHSGPYPVRSGKLEIRTRLATAGGERIRVTVVDGASGAVTEQHVYASDGTRLASAMATGHHYDPATGVTLPQTVEVQIPATQLSMKIDLGTVQINQPVGDPSQLWSLPKYDGFADIDLAAPIQSFTAPEGPPPTRLP